MRIIQAHIHRLPTERKFEILALDYAALHSKNVDTREIIGKVRAQPLVTSKLNELQKSFLIEFEKES